MLHPMHVVSPIILLSVILHLLSSIMVLYICGLRSIRTVVHSDSEGLCQLGPAGIWDSAESPRLKVLLSYFLDGQVFFLALDCIASW